ncbi:hypothetical protein [Yersinia aldovae]|uniref:hypothetical protein n=1 Tax=Yersinia aldovae TaxID=29483 RepID=UPI0005AC8ADA|nr:hypothetical protein [Yersinia aldovae]AJJ63787.1 hypothetical protein AT01_147 [Yersinia aldovae 670-83]
MKNMEELKKATQLATPGPWSVQNSYPQMVVSDTIKWTHCDGTGNPEFTLPEWVCNVGNNEANANFICLANPTAVLELIKQVETLEEEKHHWYNLAKAAATVENDAGSGREVVNLLIDIIIRLEARAKSAEAKLDSMEWAKTKHQTQ